LKGDIDKKKKLLQANVLMLGLTLIKKMNLRDTQVLSFKMISRKLPLANKPKSLILLLMKKDPERLQATSQRIMNNTNEKEVFLLSQFNKKIFLKMSLKQQIGNMSTRIMKNYLRRSVKSIKKSDRLKAKRRILTSISNLMKTRVLTSKEILKKRRSLAMIICQG